MGVSMLSKSLIQFSVDGWNCVPSLLFTWGQTMVDIMIMVISFKRSHACTATLTASNPPPPPPPTKDLHDLDNHDGMITHLQPDILECEVKWALRSFTKNKASGGDRIPVELFQILKDDAMKVLHSIC